MDSRAHVKKDVFAFIKDVVGVDDYDFKDKLLAEIWGCVFDGYDVTDEGNENVRNLNEDYIKQIPEEEWRSFIPRLKILHPRYYVKLNSFVKRCELIVRNELK